MEVVKKIGDTFSIKTSYCEYNETIASRLRYVEAIFTIQSIDYEAQEVTCSAAIYSRTDLEGETGYVRHGYTWIYVNGTEAKSQKTTNTQKVYPGDLHVTLTGVVIPMGDEDATVTVKQAIYAGTSSTSEGTDTVGFVLPLKYNGNTFRNLVVNGTTIHNINYNGTQLM